MRVGILYICIGDYVAFWKEFYLSSEKLFLPEAEKVYFVFTDKEKNEVFGSDSNKNIHVFYQENLGWPGNTLLRYKMFVDKEKMICDTDYLFFFNSNVVFRDYITAEEFLPPSNELLVVKHPGYVNHPFYELPYERRRKSKAYIPYKYGEHYVCGGINGGATKEYMKMVHTLANWIEEDSSNGIVAKWHDESMINKYIVSNTNYRILGSEYAYPEDDDSCMDNVKILILDKSKVIKLDKSKARRMKGIPFNGVKNRIKHAFLKLYFDKCTLINRKRA